jgi:Asp-tRNA(Asn)/Glu-tRNA(Gln) amidotransferase B subunit
MTSISILQKELTSTVEEAGILRQEVQSLRGRLHLVEQQVEQCKDSIATAENIIVEKNSQLQTALATLQEIRQNLSAAEAKLNTLFGVETTSPGKIAQATIALNGKSLKNFIFDVLQASNEPLTTKEIVELILEAGYKTSGDKKNLPTMVHQALTNNTEMFKKVSRGYAKPYKFALKEE